LIRLVLDMNLSPQWVAFPGSAGHEAIHWSSVGDVRATDDAIMTRAASNGRTVVTQDLDFGARLALRHMARPSVLLLRLDGSLPGDIGGAVLSVLARAAEELEAGALVVLDERHARVRRLAFRPPQHPS
jgi:predicted nuclease of predicted toxin-antitoxin system